MDLVTANLLENFTKEESLPLGLDTSTAFEHFANFCVISREFPEEFIVDDIHVGDSSDTAIDGIAVIVNGNIVTTPEEIDDLAESNRYIDAVFIFIQSTTSEKFDGSKIGNFLFGVRDFFSQQSRLPQNAGVKDKHALMTKLYQKSSLFKRGNPMLKLFYVTTGKWQQDANLQAKIDADTQLMKDIGIFTSVNFHPVDAAALQKLYNSAKNSLSKTFAFENKITLPEIDGVKEAYLGILPISDFLGLIQDDTGIILRSLFYDNVRDFQGANEVNSEMNQTLQCLDKELFVLLNNGVTIVAENLSKTGDKFHIEDYQVVNGCQTSHVLFNNKDVVTSSMHVPIKLIVLSNEEIKNKVIKATNRQTKVENEELTALTDFQKTLEQYYSACPPACRLFYERRSQQFRSVSGIEKVRIVTISTQIRAFAAMFLGEAHRASRYYGTLLNSVKHKIFVPSHPPVAYYASAFANFRLDALLRKKQISSDYRPFRYHMLHAVRLAAAGKEMPDMKTNRFENYCESIVAKLKDEASAAALFSHVTDKLDAALNGNYDRDAAKNSALATNIAAQF